MSGQAAIRGFLVQTLLGLLESLYDDKWTSVRFEPSVSDEKADLLWRSAAETRAVQVKHSTKLITDGLAKAWAHELKTSVTADSYELWLAGPTNSKLARGIDHEGVTVRPPEPLHLKALIERAAQRLDGILNANGITNVPSFAREIVVGALASYLTETSASATEVSRADFLALLLSWVRELYPNAVNRAAEDLRVKLEFEARDRVAEARFKMKYDACVETLDLVDTYYAHSLDLLPQSPENEAERIWARTRACHNRLVVSCDSKETIEAFRTAIGFSGPHSAAAVVDLRMAIRSELGFGEDSVDSDRESAWISTVQFDFDIAPETREGISRAKQRWSQRLVKKS